MKATLEKVGKEPCWVVEFEYPPGIKRYVVELGSDEEAKVLALERAEAFLSRLKEAESR